MTSQDQQRDAQVDAQMLDRAARNIRLKVGDQVAPTQGEVQAEAASAPAAPRRPARGPVPVGAGRRR
jgi:hypothetical protein